VKDIKNTANVDRQAYFNLFRKWCALFLKKNKTCIYFWLIALLVSSGVAWAAKSVLGEIQSGDYQLKAITNHMPSLHKKSEDYWNSLQRVQLELGNLDRFKDVPKLGLKNPYTGIIELGDKPDQKFGVIVDIVGEEKRLYVDTDGDGSFMGEAWTPLLNEWYGSQNYWIIAPEPIKLMVGYQAEPGTTYPVEIAVSGALIDAGLSQRVQPFLVIEVRTWFLTEVIEDGAGKMMAIIDNNHNGRFNDPEDLMLIDYNDDSFFSRDEALQRKKGITVPSGRQKLKADWDVYPKSLRIGRPDR
jgi:hypothetical protein